MQNKKIAIVCDWIKDIGGAELVLQNFLEIFPEADIYTSVFFAKHKMFEGRNIKTSFIQKLPVFNKSHKLAGFLRPLAFESFDLSEYDIVISSSTAESKGIITKPETKHFCYCHTPTRYYWSHYHEYTKMLEFGALNFVAKIAMPLMIHNFRQWDYLASKRVDYFIANSNTTSKRIQKYYNRESTVIYPCVDVEEFKFSEVKEDYYLYVGRVVPYKKFDLIVDAFNASGKKLIIATSTVNKLQKSLQKKSAKNIEWKIGLNRLQLIDLYSKAKAFLFPPLEDFGLVPVEAMACGTPVIAFGQGGATETVVDGLTGVFFEEQNVESLNNAITKFEKIKFDYKKIREYSYKFDKKEFRKSLEELVLG